MSNVKGWSHQEMASMKKRLFMRYYGYWYQKQLRKDKTRIEQELEDEFNNK